MIKIKTGTVISYDEHRCTGLIEIEGTQTELGGSYFHMSRPVRDPKYGDLLDVIVSCEDGIYDRIIYIRKLMK